MQASGSWPSCTVLRKLASMSSRACQPRGRYEQGCEEESRVTSWFAMWGDWESSVVENASVGSSQNKAFIRK